MTAGRMLWLAKHEPGIELQIQLSLDKTEAFVFLTPEACAPSAGETQIRAWLAEAGIVQGLDDGAIAELGAALQNGEAVEEKRVAAGRPPVAGVDSRLDFRVKPFSSAPRFEVEDGGRMDFHSTHLFDNVKAGEPIAEWHPPLPGEDGLDVLGHRLPALPGKWKPVRSGAGVAFREETREFIATRPGRVLFHDSVLAVTEEFRVDKNVDYRVGHIEFVGFVHVLGEVLDGFNIHGRRGIRVDNMVGECRLRSEGDIEILSMNGRHTNGNAVIQCEGNVIAGHLNNVTVECRGNVFIEKEAVHCLIKCLGRVTVAGSVIGGACIGRAGVEVGQAGTPLGIKTLLVAGLDYHLLKKTLELQSLLNEVQKIGHQLPKKMKQRKASVDLQTYSARIANSLERDLAEAKLGMAGAVSTETESADGPPANSKINVRRQLHSGAILVFEGAMREFQDAVSGAFSFLVVPNQGMKWIPLTPLSQSVQKILEQMRPEASEPPSLPSA